MAILCTLSDGSQVQIHNPPLQLKTDLSEIEKSENLFDTFSTDSSFRESELDLSGRFVERVLYHCAGVRAVGMATDEVLKIYWRSLDLWIGDEWSNHLEGAINCGHRVRDYFEDAKSYFDSLPQGEQKQREIDAEHERMVRWLRPVESSANEILKQKIAQSIDQKGKPSATAIDEAEGSIISHGNRSYSVNGQRPLTVTKGEDAVLQVFLNHQCSFDLPTLIKESEVQRADEMLRKLKTEKYDRSFAPFICRPGVKGEGGYFVRIHSEG